jgi:hypothetical protein
MKRRFFLALLGLAACGGSSTAPSGTSAPGAEGLPFQATRYFLHVLGASAPCGDLRSPQAGTSVSFFVNLTPDGTGWIARSTDDGTRVTIANTIAIAGLLPAGAPAGFQDFLRGTFNGTVTFSRNGLTATCPGGTVTFSMNRNF